MPGVTSPYLYSLSRYLFSSFQPLTVLFLLVLAVPKDGAKNVVESKGVE